MRTKAEVFFKLKSYFPWRPCKGQTLKIINGWINHRACFGFENYVSKKSYLFYYPVDMSNPFLLLLEKDKSRLKRKKKVRLDMLEIKYQRQFRLGVMKYGRRADCPEFRSQ